MLKKLEWILFRWLLNRYCNYSLDQWDAWKVTTKHGHVFVDICRYPKYMDEHYDTL